MIYDNNNQLKRWLVADGRETLAAANSFVIDDAEFEKHLMDAARSRPASEQRDAAAFRCLPLNVKTTNFYTRSDLSELNKIAGRILIAIGIVIFILIVSLFANAQNVNPAITITSCGGVTAVVGARTAATIDTTGRLCADVTGSTVTALLSTSGLATSANQTTGNTSLATIAGAVSGTEMQVDIVTMPSVTIGTFPDNEPFNLAQVNGATVTTGVGTAAGAQRVANFQHDGTAAMRVDPCSDVASTYGRTAIATALTGTVLVSGTASQYTYICGYTIVADAAVDASLTSGTGTTCGTGITALIGSTTAANGMAFSANGGITNSNTGHRQNWTQATGDDLCLLLSSAVQTSGVIIWAKSTRAP